MPEFVQSVANQQMPPPYAFPGVKAHGFLFEMSMEDAQAYCDTYFNLGTDEERGFRYQSLPLFPYAALMAIDYPVMLSENNDPLSYDSTPFSQRGYVSQSEIFVAVPVMRYGISPSNILVEAAVEFALPFIAVDNSTSAFSGREMLGLQKLQGVLDFGVGQFPGSFEGHAHLLGWPRLEAGTKQELLQFLSIHTGAPLGAMPLSDPKTSPWHLLGGKSTRDTLQALIGALTGLDTLSLGLIPSPTQVVALKQFRDAERPDFAVYQALVGAKIRYSNLTNLKFYDHNEVDIRFYDYGSFQEIIRVFLDPPPNASPDGAAIQEVKVPACAAFSFNADIEFDVMRALHTFLKNGQKLTRFDQPPGVTMLPSWFLPWRGLFARK